MNTTDRLDSTALYPWGKFGDPLSFAAPATVDRRPPNGFATANGTSATSITGRPAAWAGPTRSTKTSTRKWRALMAAYFTVYLAGLTMISVGIAIG